MKKYDENKQQVDLGREEIGVFITQQPKTTT